MAPIVCVNVDLDSLPHYCRIHGLDPSALPEPAQKRVYRVALPRFVELFEALDLRATFFAVGSDLDDAESAQALRRAAEAGHEIGNHSFSHDYALTRLSDQALARDVAAGEEAIERATGARPTGFRAPGYTLSAPLVRALSERGYRYDSSVFPAAPYWAAKALVMGGLALARRPSRAILDRPRVLLAPRLPYEPDLDEPYRRGHSGLRELPVSVEPLTRVPLIGTLAISLPRVAALAVRSLRRGPFVNFELHGIDLLDAQDVAFAPLAAAQPDLRIPLAVKRRRIAAVLRALVRGAQVRTLEEAARGGV